MTMDTVADRRVHPATIPLRFLKEAPSTILGIPAAYAFMSRPGVTGVILFAAIVAVIAILFQWLVWSRFRYGIGERDMVIESGILSRTRRSIPFDRIQDVDIERGPLARLFGLAKLRIETGGSGGDEGVLDSVTLDEAERLRTALRAARLGPAIAADETGEGAGEYADLLFEMPFSRLLVSGVLNFSLVWIAGIFAMLQAVEDWLPFDIYERSLWENAEQGLRDRLSFGALAFVASLALLLGLVTGIVRTVGRDFGFRLTLEAEGLRRQRGLLTRSDVLIPRARTQLAIVAGGPLRRLFGMFGLTFQTLSGGRGKGEGGPQRAAPLANGDEIARILSAIGGYRIADPERLEIVSSRRIIRRLIGGLGPVALIVAIALFFPAALLILPFLLIPLALAFIERRFHRFGIADGLLFVQSGVWRQRQWIVPLTRIQSLKLRRSWLQRRLALSTLFVDSAGAPSLGGVRIEDLGDERARELADRLAASIQVGTAHA